MVSDESAHSPTQLNLSFAGCGFLGIYHVGVASCIQKYAPHLISNHITGASAGSLVAAGMLCNLPIGEAATFTLNLARKARDRALGPLHPQFNITNHLRSGLEVFLPENAHTICTGRLFVSLTRVRDRKNVLMSQFDSKDDLIQCLLCSAHVPFWSGIMPPLYRGERYIDGGLSLNNPILNENTITVSPFSGESDICPDDKSASFMHVCLAGTSIQMNCGNLFRISHAFFPPVPEILSNMCKQGFDDALNYLQKSDLISCTKHLSVLSSIHSGSSFSLEQLVKEEKKLHYCDDCRQKKESLSVTSLPPPVVQALQAACDSVNKGVLATIYKMRVFKVLSLMTAPWILPFDVGIVMAQK
ncbi:hypothetical protein CAPTEDRAFT_104291 [Capitella teleta]|uniref:triacylglycerol lipase n=1 Tax=Capitella teleta TaxID=283909 RepID=R7T7W4_CAPTE|nr:hypothetical protein CAPTEDRAFT_104291 [Capitella teleta]|eukprot:ELT89705.1 hypothetical protein CAPTEDRAFT_104291 [Capitella teleta]